MKKKDSSSVTIKDISRACGVSPSTVSKALNGYGDVAQETAELIRDTAKKLHYVPNMAARQLKTNMSFNIGVIFEDETRVGLSHEYFSEILDSAKRTAEQRGFDFTFIGRGVYNSSLLEHCRYRHVDGVLIVCGDFDDPEIGELAESEIPTVTIDYTFPSHSCVLSDNRRGEYELTKYLISCGHRRIAFIHGENTTVTRERIRGFLQAMGEAGIPVPEGYLIEGRYHDAKKARETARQAVSLPELPTAILFPDDFSYLGGQVELEKMGLSIPDDISAAGYDGIRLSQVIRPRLTTYRQDAVRIGEVSAGRLLEDITSGGSKGEYAIQVKGELLTGQTVKKIG